MANQITVSEETIQCLRGHLQAANDLFNSLANRVTVGAQSGTVPKPKKRVTKVDRVSKYSDMLSGVKVKKPNHLKK